MIIHPLSEGEFTIAADKVFIPFDSQKDVLETRPRGSLLVEIQPFLIEIGPKLILCDTGLGFADSGGDLQVHQNLARLGYTPADITHVLLSHLHKDHAGGLLYRKAGGTPEAAFPEAAYYIYKPEWDFAHAKGAPSYILSDFEGLDATTQIHWLEGTEGTVDENISWQHSGAHCPQHIVWKIREDDEIAFFGGDEAPQLRQMKMRYIARYDYNGEAAMKLREQYGAAGRQEGWQFLFYHDIASPVSVLK